MMLSRHVLHQSYRRARRRLPFIRYFSLTSLVLILIWMLVLYWGERRTFSSHIAACDWKSWETWGQDANPHHMVLVADPQLVDPHTYPGRPWPLDTLTEIYTDMYMARNFRLINGMLDPASVVFVGDLLDGGREWSTTRTPPTKDEMEQDQGTQSDPVNPQSFVYGEHGRWSRWGPEQWKVEFDRFGKIFLAPHQLYPYSANPLADQHGTTVNGVAARHRQVLTNLPGNHDLGFGAKVQLSVRERFESHFGKSNSVDILGNHTFISVDAPSYSAYDQFLDGGLTTDDDGRELTQSIWQPTEDFLDNIETTAANALAASLRPTQSEKHRTLPLPHQVVDTADLTAGSVNSKPTRRAAAGQSKLPVVLLTHVPLFRMPDTDCGPQREKGHAIAIEMGYQYQNILTQELSNRIVQKVSAAGNIRHVFSGDDHDYCEMSHRFNLKSWPDGQGSGAIGLQTIKEITVKSFSWAMGVHLPGFLLVSLWNPIDELGQSLESRASTIQTHLCLLPDQLTIFILYGKLLLLTWIVVLVRAFIVAAQFNPLADDESDEDGSPTQSLLPRFQPNLSDQIGAALSGDPAYKSRRRDHKSHSRNRASSISTSSSANANSHLSVQRNFFTRTRSVSPAAGAQASSEVELKDLSVQTAQSEAGVPLIEQAGYYPQQYRWENPSESDEDSHNSGEALDSQAKWKRREKPLSTSAKFFVEIFATLATVALPGALFYALLISRG